MFRHAILEPPQPASSPSVCAQPISTCPPSATSKEHDSGESLGSRKERQQAAPGQSAAPPHSTKSSLRQLVVPSPRSTQNGALRSGKQQARRELGSQDPSPHGIVAGTLSGHSPPSATSTIPPSRSAKNPPSRAGVSAASLASMGECPPASAFGAASGTASIPRIAAQPIRVAQTIHPTTSRALIGPGSR